MAVQHDRVRFGAAYYYEYAGPGQDPKPETLERDLDLMQAAAFSVIRVGESVWSTLGARRGQVRAGLARTRPRRGARPRDRRGHRHSRRTRCRCGWSAATRRSPARTAPGSPMGWGARQEADFTHPVFRFYAERILRKIVERYRDHPAVIGFQVDNEPGLHLLHNRGVFQRFVDHLRHTYGDVETLNREWGLVYWSHRLSSWADLWTPDGNAQPQYDLAWRTVPGRPDHGDDRVAGPSRSAPWPARTSSSPPASPTNAQPSRTPTSPPSSTSRAGTRTTACRTGSRTPAQPSCRRTGRPTARGPCSSRATRCSPAAASRSW